jgi:hypothetical protein
MKKLIMVFGISFSLISFANCGSKITVCDCLKDDGSHKKECDKLGNSMTTNEMNKAIAKCK